MYRDYEDQLKDTADYYEKRSNKLEKLLKNLLKEEEIKKLQIKSVQQAQRYLEKIKRERKEEIEDDKEREKYIHSKRGSVWDDLYRKDQIIIKI